MGTRNMIAVKQAGVFKVANYGQWDGYPTGQGEGIRAFLSEVDLSIFEKKVSACRAITNEELEAIPENDGNWVKEYPWLSRDAGSDILKYIMEDKSVLKMAEDCLISNMWIEWSYLIDLDTMTFSLYRGTILSGDKYARAPQIANPISTIYKSNRPMCSYSLNNLPSKEEWNKKYKRY